MQNVCDTAETGLWKDCSAASARVSHPTTFQCHSECYIVYGGGCIGPRPPRLGPGYPRTVQILASSARPKATCVCAHLGCSRAVSEGWYWQAPNRTGGKLARTLNRLSLKLSTEPRGCQNVTAVTQPDMLHFGNSSVYTCFRVTGWADNLHPIDQWRSQVIRHATSTPCCRAVYLHVITSNHSAIRFYDRFQFEYVRHMPQFYFIPSDRAPQPGQLYYDALLFVLYVNKGRPPFSLLGTFVQTVQCCTGFLRGVSRSVALASSSIRVPLGRRVRVA
eukprot:1180197-Prorocentrum_minimum.AAC.2